MASVYPGSKDSLSTTHNAGDTILNTVVNDLADAVNKIENELGTLPKGVYADAKTRLNTVETLVFNAQVGTAYTLVLGDATGCVTMNNAAANTLTVPPNSSVAFPIGTEIRVRMAGVGATSIAGGSGVTIVNPYSSFTLAAQNAEAKLLKIATNSWSLNGEVV